MKYLFSFLCLCCVLSVSAQKPVVINLAKAISESPKEIMLNELASDIRYVPLETTDDCLMNNEFYIMQYTGEDIITSGIFILIRMESSSIRLEVKVRVRKNTCKVYLLSAIGKTSYYMFRTGLL